jgi:hypothetical protein
VSSITRLPDPAHTSCPYQGRSNITPTPKALRVYPDIGGLSYQGKKNSLSVISAISNERSDWAREKGFKSLPPLTYHLPPQLVFGNVLKFMV